MFVRIQPLTNAERVEARLQQDGWRLDNEESHLTAYHPQVRDEQDARGRLCRLGLLTSPVLRIEFFVALQKQGPINRGLSR
jgi:hypothetical protein